MTLRLPQLSGSLAVCLWCMLGGALCLPARGAAGPEVPVSRLEEGIHPVETVYETPGSSLYLASVEGLHCIVLAGSGGNVHMVIASPREKPRTGAETSRFKESVRRLHAYLASLATDPAQVRLIPFAGGQLKAAIMFTPESHRTSFSRCVLGDSTVNVIDTAVRCGAGFSSLEGGLLTMVLPDKDKSSERCALIISLHTGTVKVAGFSPPPSQGKKESSAVASLCSNLRIPAASIDTKADAETLRNVCQRVGVTRCLSKGPEYALVLYNKKLYAGAVNDLRAFVRECKKDKSDDGFLGEFTFPSSSAAIPEPGGTPSEPEPEPSGDPAPQPTPAPDTPSAPEQSTPPPTPPSPAPATPAAPENPALQDYLRYLEGLKNA